MKKDNLCRIDLVAAGLPYRTELLIARERRAIPSMIGRLFGRGEGESTLPSLTAEVLEQALASEEAGSAYTAAFLIGRCRAVDSKIDAALTHRLEQVIAGTPEPDVAIEAAMSLALRGYAERGRRALCALLDSSYPLGDQYKAAFYLAQMGDPSGYERLVNTLHSEIPHYRLMAARHALAFAPYEGQKINDVKVDVRQLLVERLADLDELVRSEVPFLLEELRISDLRTLLQPVARHDRSPSVRTAAQIVLDRNR
jgi:hypothetical protein